MLDSSNEPCDHIEIDWIPYDRKQFIHAHYTIRARSVREFITILSGIGGFDHVEVMEGSDSFYVWRKLNQGKATAMGVREDRLVRWPVEVYINEMPALGVMDKFYGVENYAKENGYILDVYYTGRSAQTDELTKLLIEVERLKIPPGPVAVLPHVHSRTVVFSGEDRAVKANKAMELARPMQLKRLKQDIFRGYLCSKALLSDQDFEDYVLTTRKFRSFVQGYTSLANPGYEITLTHNEITFHVLHGVNDLRRFSATLHQVGDQVKISIRVDKESVGTTIGTFDPTYENGQNAWKIASVHLA